MLLTPLICLLTAGAVTMQLCSVALAHAVWLCRMHACGAWPTAKCDCTCAAPQVDTAALEQQVVDRKERERLEKERDA